MAPSMSNFPPGVSGFEPEVAGCSEIEEERTCPECSFEGFVTVEVGPHDQQWTCPTCNYTSEENIMEYYDDSDSGRYEDDYFDSYYDSEMDCGV
jgi:rubredoxin